MHGNAFRVLIDKDHKSGSAIQGRFDLWALKTPDFVPEVIIPVKKVCLEIGKCYQFSSTNYPDRSPRHRNKEVWLDARTNDKLFKADSTFKIFKGLNGDPDYITLMATNYPEFYWKHWNYDLYADGDKAPLDGSFKVSNDDDCNV